METWWHARLRYWIALVVTLTLAVGLVAGVMLERYRGAAADYVAVEQALLTQHYSTKLFAKDLRNSCFRAMAKSLGDPYTVYLPAVLEEADYDEVPSGLARPAPPPGPVVSCQSLPATSHRFVSLRIRDFIEGHDVPTGFDRAVASCGLISAEGLVVDLRGNYGGLIDHAVDVASAWLGKRPVVRLDYRSGKSDLRMGPRQTALATVPTVILVDESTASAAEIFTGALQDYGLAHVIGGVTFGKGVGVAHISLDDGAVLQVTIVRWFTPKGRYVGIRGLTPDEYLEDAGDVAGETDEAMNRAVTWLSAVIEK